MGGKGNVFRSRLFFLVLFMFVVSFSSVHTVSSGKDLVSIEYPSRVLANEYFNIKLHIDPEIGQYVNYIILDGLKTDYPESEKFPTCKTEKIPYDGSNDVTLKVYPYVSWTDENKIQIRKSTITLSRVGTIEEIDDILGEGDNIDSYTPEENNPDDDYFIYPFMCTVNGIHLWDSIPLLKLKFTQELVPQKVEMDIPDNVIIGSYMENRSHFTYESPSLFSYSGVEGITEGTPPYHDFVLSRRPRDTHNSLTSYEEFKNFFEKNTITSAGRKGGKGTIYDLPTNIINSFGGGFGFYSYDISPFHDSRAEDEDEIYYYMSFIAEIYPKGARNYYEIRGNNADVTNTYSEQEVINELLDRISSIHLVYISPEKSFDKPYYIINNGVLPLLSGTEFEEPEEEPEEEKDIAEKEFTIKFSGPDKETIWNRGRFNVKDDDSFQILIKNKGKAKDKKGKRIKKISDEQLYEGVKLIAKIKGEDDSQIGFGSSLSKDFSMSVTNYLETIDVRGKGPHLYKSFYKPIEKIKIYLEWNGRIVSNELEFIVNIKDASPNIEIKKPTIEVQDGNKRMISFKVKDADKSKLTCSLMVPTDFAIKGGIPFATLSYDGKKTTFIKIDCEDGDNIKVMYYAPSFGNFDLNNELNALSMWKMQQNTMTTLATDMVGFVAGGRIEVLKKDAQTFNKAYGLTGTVGHLKNAQNAMRAAKYLDKANDMAGNAQNLIKLTQLAKTKEGLGKGFDKATGTGKQGWLEWGADWGVYGIDVAQSTIGTIAMAPGKIPVLGPLGKKVGGTFSIVFNLMTNVWKGNLQYLSIYV